MANYSQSEIDNLIGCLKRITSPPARMMRLVDAHRRNDMKLAAAVEGIEGEFRVFMRQSEDFPENFSIGLTFYPRDQRGEVTPLRCNGPHGDFNSAFDPQHPHSDFHVHRATETAIEQGLRAERVAEATRAYGSYEEAVRFFIREINLRAEDAEEHFREELQMSFDLGEGSI